MKNAPVEQTGAGSKTSFVKAFYPAPETKSKPNVNLISFVASLRSSNDVNHWLSLYNALPALELLAAHCLRDAYCQKRYDSSLVRVLSRNSLLEVAWLFKEATLEAASTCAALYAFYCLEGGVCK